MFRYFCSLFYWNILNVGFFLMIVSQLFWRYVLFYIFFLSFISFPIFLSNFLDIISLVLILSWCFFHSRHYWASLFWSLEPGILILGPKNPRRFYFCLHSWTAQSFTVRLFEILCWYMIFQFCFQFPGVLSVFDW